ncbi:MAG: peptidylprolyl isomerase [Pseudomonadota bacterium]
MAVGLSQASMGVNSVLRSFAKLLREPLVQFLCIGLVVYGVDSFVFENTENPRRIRIDDARFQSLVDIYREERGQFPSGEELEALLVTWTQNEVMYREALSMGLDRGDEMIRSRMVLKLRDVLFNNVIVETPDDETLEAWFESNRLNYDRPDIIDFQQFQIDADDVALTPQLVDAANAGGLPDRYTSRIKSYEMRIDDNLYSVFDDSDARALISAPLREWRPASSSQGKHVVRITRRVPGELAQFDRVRAAVLSDWSKQAREAELAQALREIVEDYDITYEFSRDMVQQNLAASSGTSASAD